MQGYSNKVRFGKISDHLMYLYVKIWQLPKYYSLGLNRAIVLALKRLYWVCWMVKHSIGNQKYVSSIYAIGVTHAVAAWA